MKMIFKNGRRVHVSLVFTCKDCKWQHEAPSGPIKNMEPCKTPDNEPVGDCFELKEVEH